MLTFDPLRKGDVKCIVPKDTARTAAAVSADEIGQYPLIGSIPTIPTDASWPAYSPATRSLTR